ncbi:MAG TPA: FAD-dependent oxidoreductase [Anaerolineae bacterium]|nr:FAD-dependent oxidoreductase [Anaerolineae bacterium]HQI83920.1 FAD-dependent oxidoreductase [Anaerolineae bacterium]
MFEFTISQESPKAEVSGGLYDVVIIGGGAAGLTTAIYTSRDGLKTLILEREGTGGLAATTEMIENYPGFPDGINGMELLERFRKQAERFGAEIVEFDEVVKVNPIKKGEIEVHTQNGEVYTGKTVVIATGSRPKKLNIPGENEFYGRGVSYCATCDGPFFKDKNVVIIGAGNSGLQEGLQVLEYAKHVTFLEFLPYTRAEQILQDRVKNHPKSTLLFNQQVTAIKGEKSVTSVVAVDRETKEERLYPTDGVFIYVGYSPYSQFVAELVETNKWGYIVTDEKMRTKVAGLYAIGDVRADNPAQLSVSVGDGAKAALAIRDFILELQA